MLTPLALACALLGGTPAEVGPADGQVVVRGSTVFVSVEHGGDDRAGADRTLAVILRALPRIGDATHRAFPGPRELRVQLHDAKERVGGVTARIDPKTQRLALWNRAGSLDLVDALCRYWFASPRAEEPVGRDAWVLEGLIRFTTVRVLASDMALGDPVFAHRAMLAARKDAPAGWDAPLSAGPPPAGSTGRNARSAWNTKAYAFFHVLHAIAGDRALTQVLRQFHRDAPVTTEQLLTLANQFGMLGGIDDPQFGPGWVVAGDYHAALSPALAEDDDLDGLSNAEERRLGTAPDRADSDGDGEVDGREHLVTRTDPLDAASKPDPKFEGPGGRASDIGRSVLALSAAVSGEELCVHLMVPPRAATAKGHHFNICILRPDGIATEEMIAWDAASDPCSAIITRHFHTDWHPLPLAAARRAVGGLLELRIPLAALASEGPVRLYAFASSRRSGQRFPANANGVGWVPLTLPKRR